MSRWIRIIALVLALTALWSPACKSGQSTAANGDTTSSSVAGTSKSGNLLGTVGEDLKVGDADITVRALQATFQPAMPTQRLSESTPSAPVTGESFYQAYVRVKNNQTTPLRVDPQDFACAIGSRVVSIEPTRSGPYARSLLTNTSIDLLLTFKGPAGYQPMLIYSPPWYNGVISIGPKAEEEPGTTTTSTG